MVHIRQDPPDTDRLRSKKMLLHQTAGIEIILAHATTNGQENKDRYQRYR